MKPTLLIVDDMESITNQFAGYASGDLEVLTANSSARAYELARQAMPTIATVDFEIDDHNGNDVGKQLKIINPSIKLAGITGGRTGWFDESLFDIREAKQYMDQKKYTGLVRCLLSANPKEKYGRLMGEQAAQNEYIQALYILMQGYNAARKVQRGEQPFEGLELDIPVPSEEMTLELLDIEKIGMKPFAVFIQLCRYKPDLEEDQQVASFFTALSEKKFSEIREQTTQYMEELLQKILE